MFNRGRLIIARQRRQLSKKELAEKAKVSQVTLTRIETGLTEDPEEATISALASALNYPVEFFYLDDCEVLQTESASFRSLSSLTAKQRDAALAAASLAFEFSDWVSNRFNLPPSDIVDLRHEDPRAAAGALRRCWGLGSKPVLNLINVLEAKGVRVFSLSERNKNVDAFSCWRGKTPFIFLNTFKSAERSRFDAAHEIGHLVMHRHGVAGDRNLEKEADQFAAAFLVPPEDLICHLPSVGSVSQLVSGKKRWGVSVAALARNLFEAGLVSDWHYRELCKRISALGYRTKEPAPMAREGSMLWRKVFEFLWKDRVGKEAVAKSLCWPTDEIVALVGGLYGDTNQSAVRAERPSLKVI